MLPAGSQRTHWPPAVGDSEAYAACFAHVGATWQKHVSFVSSFSYLEFARRPTCSYVRGDASLAMSIALYRKLSISLIRSTMSAQYLSKCLGQVAGQCTMRTSGSTVGPGAVPVSRQFALRRPSVQLHFSRNFLTQQSRPLFFPVRAEDPDTTQIGQTDQSSASAATQLLGGDEQQPFPGVQSESGVELISQAIPTEAVLSASVTETNSRPADSHSSTDSTSGNWESAFQSLLDVISKGQHFEGRTPTAKQFSIGVLKRGVLNFARSRQDILFSLPAEKIQAVLAAGLPYQERKVFFSVLP